MTRREKDKKLAVLRLVTRREKDKKLVVLSLVTRREKDKKMKSNIVSDLGMKT